MVLFQFFFLKSPEYNAADTVHRNIYNHTTLQPMTKYMNHPSIDNIQRQIKYALVKVLLLKKLKT